MKSDLLKQRIAEGRYDDILIDLYNDEKHLSYQKQRYIRAIEKYEATFAVDNISIFSVSPSIVCALQTSTNTSCFSILFFLLRQLKQPVQQFRIRHAALL